MNVALQLRYCACYWESRDILIRFIRLLQKTSIILPGRFQCYLWKHFLAHCRVLYLVLNLFVALIFPLSILPDGSSYRGCVGRVVIESTEETVSHQWFDWARLLLVFGHEWGAILAYQSVGGLNIINFDPESWHDAYRVLRHLLSSDCAVPSVGDHFCESMKEGDGHDTASFYGGHLPFRNGLRNFNSGP